MKKHHRSEITTRSIIKAITGLLPKRVSAFIFIILMCFCARQLRAQNNHVIDSLTTVLETAKEDTSKVKIMNELGWQYYKSRQYDSSMMYASEALLLAEKLVFKKGVAIAHKNIGNNFADLGELSEALNHHLLSLKISEEIGDKQNMAKCYLNIAGISHVQGNYSEAEKNYLKGLKINEEIGDKAGTADTHGSISRFYIIQGDYDEALKHTCNALEINKEIGDNTQLARCYNNIASIYQHQGNYPEALKNLEVGLNYANDSGDKLIIGDCYNHIAQVHFRQGNYMDALNNFTTALNIFSEIGHKVGIAVASGNIGATYSALGNLPEALKYNLATLKLNEELGNKQGVFSSLLNIGAIYYSEGNYAVALEHYMECLEISQEINAKGYIALSYSTIGLVYSNQKNFSEALKYLQESLKINNELGEKNSIANDYLNIGGIYNLMENYPEALKYYRLSIQLSKEIGNKKDMAKAYIDMASIYICQAESENPETAIQKYADANQYFIQGLSISKEMKSIEFIKQCYRGLSHVDSIQSNFSLALEHYKMYILYKDSLLNEESNKQMANLKIKYETEKKDKEILLLNKENDINILKIRQQKMLRNGGIITMALLILLGFLLFRSQHLRKKLEKQGAIIQERKRISADLHDDVGTGLSKISLLSELVRSEARTPEAKKEAEKIADTAKELLQSIGEIIWALNANNDNLENLVAYIRRFAGEYFENSSVKLTITVPRNIPNTIVSGEYRRNIFYAVKEALHNIMKHAQATETEIHFSLKNNILSVDIHDNGKGMPEGELNRFGNGIKNMKSRMEKIKGKFTIMNNAGTQITLALPV